MGSAEKEKIKATGFRAALASLILFGGVACDNQNQLKETPIKVNYPISTPILIPTPTRTIERIEDLSISSLGKLEDKYRGGWDTIELCEALPIESSLRETTGKLTWPVYGMLSQFFGEFHQGIDVSAPYGTPVYAADGGVVVLSLKLEWSYGYHIIIDNGAYLTLYAHLSEILVGLGDEVSKEKVVGRVGLTGKSNGPHLHFEVIKKEENSCQKINPLKVLP